MNQPYVLILTQTLGVGGLERMIYNLSISLSEHGKFKPIVFVYDHLPDQPNIVSLFRENGIEVITYTKPNGWSVKLGMDILDVMKEKNIKVIHTHDLNNLIYGAMVKFFSIFTYSVKLVHTQHSFVHLIGKPRDVWFERLFVLLVDRLTAVSYAVFSGYKTNAIVTSQIQVIENGVSFAEKSEIQADTRSEYRRKLVKENSISDAISKKVWLIYLARINRGKGQDHALTIWKKSNLSDRAHLFIVGQITDGAFCDEVHAIAATCTGVSFIGPTSYPKDWLLASDLFISASEFEGLPLGPLEAVGSGMKAVLSDIPGHGPLKASSAVFDLGKPDLASNILRNEVDQFIGEKPDARLIRFDKSSQFRKTYGLEKMTEKYESVYAEAISI